jgi:hypothetical protein
VQAVAGLVARAKRGGDMIEREPLPGVDPRAHRQKPLTRARLLLLGIAGTVGAGLERTADARAADGGSLTLGANNTSTASTNVANNGVDLEAFEVDATGNGADGIVGITTAAPTANNGDPSGVIGESANGDGIFGFSPAGGFAGVFGQSSSSTGSGVEGFNSSGVSGAVGVKGTSDGGYGLYGVSSSGSGVVGSSSSGPGLQGFSTSQTGLTGSSQSTYGAFGSSQSGPGLGGFSVSGIGGFFQTQNGSQWAGYVNNAANGNGLFVNGNFAVVNGTKSAAVEIDGELHLMFALESPQSLFEDVGQGSLVHGRARIALDPLFAKTIDAGKYHVFLTPASASSKGLAVTSRDVNGFEVRELESGRGSYAFDYRIVAVRKDIKPERMPRIARPTPPAPVESHWLTRHAPSQPNVARGRKLTIRRHK